MPKILTEGRTITMPPAGWWGGKRVYCKRCSTLYELEVDDVTRDDFRHVKPDRRQPMVVDIVEMPCPRCGYPNRTKAKV